MATYQIKEELELATSVDEAWDFISSPENLKEITPDYMGFEINTPGLSDKIYPGLMISYWVRPVGGIKMAWLTEITQVKEPHYFVDEQRSGPYALWHHEHRLSPTEKGVLMTDLVPYLEAIDEIEHTGTAPAEHLPRRLVEAGSQQTGEKSDKKRNPQPE